MYDKLNNINNLRKHNKLGIYKKWIYKNLIDYYLTCDYLQKICFSIEDINEVLSKNELEQSDIIFIIVLVDWIKDSYSKIFERFKEKVAEKFVYSKNVQLARAKKYFVAIRSYVVAHPMNTTRHDDFGFDGDFICVDIRTKNNLSMLFVQFDQYNYIDYCGLHDGENKEHKYCLCSYSKKIDGYKYSKYISFSINDILNVANLYIEALYELDTFLSKLKRKVYKLEIENVNN